MRIGIHLLFIIFLSCSRQDVNEITSLLDQFYATYKFDSKSININSLSDDFATLVSTALKRETEEVNKVKTSNYPDEKPLILEGSLFTSLYEGYDKFQIDSVGIDMKQAIVRIHFFNQELARDWYDSIILTKENSWKIDNVQFGQRPGIKDTKELFKRYIQSN
ncbi:MAG: hypothetical protein KDD94_10245 [Calditrichaeota bacterium]|nr:hypothetical protein [Calditrichota bacterium]